MARSQEQPELLYVEGVDDEHSIRHILLQNGIAYEPKPQPPLPRIEVQGGFEQVLGLVETSVMTGGGDHIIGFVLDANHTPLQRWENIRNRLVLADVDAPEKIPAGGFVGSSMEYGTRVGVWLMPDNKVEGTLETFLRGLIDEGDGLIEHAQEASQKAKNLGASFTDNAMEKATLHAWLAWQKEPGRPYGTAIKAKYFRHDSEAAVAFVAWFRKLYGVDAAA